MFVDVGENEKHLGLLLLTFHPIKKSNECIFQQPICDMIRHSLLPCGRFPNLLITEKSHISPIRSNSATKMASRVARAALPPGYLSSSVEMEVQQILRRCVWVRLWLQRRNGESVYHNLPLELCLEYEYKQTLLKNLEAARV